MVESADSSGGETHIECFVDHCGSVGGDGLCGGESDTIKRNLKRSSRGQRESFINIDSAHHHSLAGRGDARRNGAEIQCIRAERHGRYRCQDAEIVNIEVVLVVAVVVDGHIFGAGRELKDDFSPGSGHICIVGQLRETAEITVGGGIHHFEVLVGIITLVVEFDEVIFVGVQVQFRSDEVLVVV